MLVKAAPELNMAILANGAELTRLTVVEMMSNKEVKHLFNNSANRETVYRIFMAAVRKKLDTQIRDLPTGQFGLTTLLGKHQSGAVVPNVSTEE